MEVYGPIYLYKLPCKNKSPGTVECIYIKSYMMENMSHESGWVLSNTGEGHGHRNRVQAPILVLLYN